MHVSWLKLTDSLGSEAPGGDGGRVGVWFIPPLSIKASDPLTQVVLFSNDAGSSAEWRSAAFIKRLITLPSCCLLIYVPVPQTHIVVTLKDRDEPAEQALCGSLCKCDGSLTQTSQQHDAQRRLRQLDVGAGRSCSPADEPGSARPDGRSKSVAPARLLIGGRSHVTVYCSMMMSSWFPCKTIQQGAVER